MATVRANSPFRGISALSNQEFRFKCRDQNTDIGEVNIYFEKAGTLSDNEIHDMIKHAIVTGVRSYKYDGFLKTLYDAPVVRDSVINVPIVTDPTMPKNEIKLVSTVEGKPQVLRVTGLKL